MRAAHIVIACFLVVAVLCGTYAALLYLGFDIWPREAGLTVYDNGETRLIPWRDIEQRPDPEYQPHSYHHQALMAACRATLNQMGLSERQEGGWSTCFSGAGVLTVTDEGGDVLGSYSMVGAIFDSYEGDFAHPQELVPTSDASGDGRAILTTASGETYLIKLVAPRSPAEWFVTGVTRCGLDSPGQA